MSLKVLLFVFIYTKRVVFGNIKWKILTLPGLVSYERKKIYDNLFSLKLKQILRL